MYGFLVESEMTAYHTGFCSVPAITQHPTLKIYILQYLVERTLVRIRMIEKIVAAPMQDKDDISFLQSHHLLDTRHFHEGCALRNDMKTRHVAVRRYS